MDFYYLSNNGERTRASQDSLNSLVRSGAITPRTLVWWEGMESWVSCGEIRPGLFTLEGLTGAGSSVATAATATPILGAAGGTFRPPTALLKAAAIGSLGLTAACVLSVFLMPFAWIPLLMGVHLFKAAGEAEGVRAGDATALAVYDDAMGRFWKFFIVGAWILAILLLALIIYTLLGLSGSLPFPTMQPKVAA